MKPSNLAKGVLGAFAGAAALIALSASASAYVVCNDHGDCWHSGVKYEYPDVKVVYYEDSWDWKAHHDHWHDTSGDYGYWDSEKNAWVTVHPVKDRDGDGDNH